jgi:integrase
MDQHFDESKHQDLVDFCQATGLRRHELVAVTPLDVYWQNEKLIAYVRQGKGGKAREVTVLQGTELRLLQIIEGRPPGKPIFAKIPTTMDVHSYRAQYAAARLEQAEIIEVSRDLGHNRTDVIRGHYAGRR